MSAYATASLQLMSKEMAQGKTPQEAKDVVFSKRLRKPRKRNIK